MRVKNERELDIPLHVDAASGGFVWPFIYPETKWDFRLEQVRSINVSGHKFGYVYPGIGWLVLRSADELPEDIVFYENYLGKTDSTFTLNFSTGASLVLAQYYMFCRLGRAGYPEIAVAMKLNASHLGVQLTESGRFEVIGARTSSYRWPASASPGRTPSTSSTSRASSPPSAAGCCPPTRCRRTPRT